MEKSPGAALFLLRHLRTTDPDYGGAMISIFQARREAEAQVAWLAKLRTEIDAALSGGNWRAAERVLTFVHAADPHGEHTQELERLVRQGRLRLLLEQARAAYDQQDFDAVERLADEMTALDTEYQPAHDLLKQVETQRICAALYEQVKSAHAAKRVSAVAVMMRYINAQCPGFGDPEGCCPGRRS